jgi:hypothetical protein
LFDIEFKQADEMIIFKWRSQWYSIEFASTARKEAWVTRLVGDLVP